MNFSVLVSYKLKNIHNTRYWWYCSVFPYIVLFTCFSIFLPMKFKNTYNTYLCNIVLFISMYCMYFGVLVPDKFKTFNTPVFGTAVLFLDKWCYPCVLARLVRKKLKKVSKDTFLIMFFSFPKWSVLQGFNLICSKLPNDTFLLKSFRYPIEGVLHAYWCFVT